MAPQLIPLCGCCHAPINRRASGPPQPKPRESAHKPITGYGRPRAAHRRYRLPLPPAHIECLSRRMVDSASPAAHLDAHVCVCACVRARECMCPRARSCVCLCVRMRVCVCACVCARADAVCLVAACLDGLCSPVNARAYSSLSYSRTRRSCPLISTADLPQARACVRDCAHAGRGCAGRATA